jgi:hypothetical protein
MRESFSQKEGAELRKTINSTRGAAAVEFGILAPLLFVIIFGIIEFGAIFYNQAVITNASREAARFAAGFYTNPENAAAARPDCGHIRNYVVNYVHKYFFNFASSTPFGNTNVICCGTDDPACPTSTADAYFDYGSYEGNVDRIRIQSL